MAALLRKIVWCTFCLMIAYHGYATAAVTCHTMTVEIGAGTDDCAEMAGKAAENEDGSCCHGGRLCCSDAAVAYAPVPVLPLLITPSIPPEHWLSPRAEFSSHIPAVLHPPPRA